MANSNGGNDSSNADAANSNNSPHQGNGNGNGNGSAAGRVLNNRYALINIVGGGGMAQVYKARDNILGRIVAVKVLREQFASDTQFVARFRREAQAAANLTHPNIVNVYDVGQDGEIHFIVMEFISGRSLKELITRNAPLPVDQAVSFASQILAGLEYAHRSGLIHRDIKPQNVLITDDGVVKVTDFGIAKSVSDLGLTEAGQALGTAHYFSPEQARGERVVPQSDIYAVGVTLYEMLTGRLPFESDNAVGLAYKHISETPPSPRALNANIPVRLETIVLKALSKEPQHRYSSAAEMERALQGLQLVGQQPTLEMRVPAARPRVTQLGAQGGARTGNLRGGAPTNSLRGNSAPRTIYGTPTTVTGSGGGAGVQAATRHVSSPLGSPTSMAMRPATVKVQGEGIGCSPAAIAFIILGLLAVIVAGIVLVSPRLPSLSSFFGDTVVPSPTPTPIIPTATPVPPTPTPTNTATSTPTSTPTPTATPQSAVVPQLVGLTLQDATNLAKQKGFVLLNLGTIITPDFPEGQVAQQNPEPNTYFQQTRQIAVRVSAGPPSFTLPDFANTDPIAAQSVLTAAGLKVRVVNTGSDTIPSGIVITTKPGPGSSIKPGDTIQLLVSMGPTSIVPNLIGIENIDLATQRITAANLQVGTVTEQDDPNESVPPGAVLSQNPPKGTEVPRDSTVDIVLRKKQ